MFLAWFFFGHSYLFAFWQFIAKSYTLPETLFLISPSSHHFSCPISPLVQFTTTFSPGFPLPSPHTPTPPFPVFHFLTPFLLGSHFPLPHSLPPFFLRSYLPVPHPSSLISYHLFCRGPTFVPPPQFANQGILCLN